MLQTSQKVTLSTEEMVYKIMTFLEKIQNKLFPAHIILRDADLAAIAIKDFRF